MKIRHNLLKVGLFLSLIVWIACAETFLGKEPDNTPNDVFEAYWQGMNEHYVGIDAYGVNWDSIYAVYKPQVANVKNERALFELLVNMSRPFKDGHFFIDARKIGYYSYPNPQPTHFLGVNAVARYMVPKQLKGNSRVKYGNISDSIFYMHVANVSGPDATDFKIIDQILEENPKAQGAIIDIRNNYGGNEAWSRLIASRFTDQERIYQYQRSRIGKKITDMSDFFASTVKPEGAKQFTKPIILLTNRYVASAGESFALMMRTLPYVRQVGDNTSGLITGYPIERELPNGWTYWCSIALTYDPNKQLITNGLVPHVRAELTKQDTSFGRDAVLEKAIELLK
jgi:carboxyl-terminal processing protease